MSNSSDNFVHLHVHTEYSMLDGAAKVDKLLDKAVDFGMPAIAITDHGNNFGAFDFWEQATKKGIRPIIGIEAYLAPGSRLDKSRTYWADGGEDDLAKGAYSHLTMLSTDNESMMNLFKLSSYAWLEGYYFQPRFIYIVYFTVIRSKVGKLSYLTHAIKQTSNQAIKQSRNESPIKQSRNQTIKQCCSKS